MKRTLFFQNNHPDLKVGAPLGGIHFPHERGVAFFGDNAFFVSGINRGGSVQYALCQNPSLASLKNWVAKTFSDPNPQESDYEPGTAYKRIHRPLGCAGSFRRAIDDNKLTESLVALRIRLGEMEKLFETVEPTAANLHCYGQRIRELLLLACMEVESSWAAVLEANGYAVNKPLKTTDYVKLLAPMLLDSYRLSLRSYPGFPSFAPFEGWDRSQPTKSLPWYDAYNKTKHNRERNLDAATLQYTVHAIGAAVVMFHAQFGFQLGPSPANENLAAIRNVFSVNAAFDLYPTSCYIPAISIDLNSQGNAFPQPKAGWDWTLINYPFP